MRAFTTGATKADFISEKLDMEAFETIKDIVTADPRPPDIFEQVKNRLISTFGASAEMRLRQLIKGQVSTIGKPSLILNRLRSLNTGAGDDIIRAVFLDQLPSHCKANLAISEVTDTHKLAQMADKIVEAMDSNQYHTHIADVHDPQIDVLSSNQPLSARFDTLVKRFDRFERKLVTLAKKVDNNSLFQPRSFWLIPRA